MARRIARAAFLQTLGMQTMGFSGNLSNLSTLGDSVNPTRVRSPTASPPAPSTSTGSARSSGIATSSTSSPGAGQLPTRQRPGQPVPRHGAPDPVGAGEHRPEAVRVGDRHPAQLVRPRPLPERDHAPAGHQRLRADPGPGEARHGLAHQGRLPEHRADRDVGPVARPRAAARRTSRRSCAHRPSPTR